MLAGHSKKRSNLVHHPGSNRCAQSRGPGGGSSPDPAASVVGCSHDFVCVICPVRSSTSLHLRRTFRNWGREFVFDRKTAHGSAFCRRAEAHAPFRLCPLHLGRLPSGENPPPVPGSPDAGAAATATALIVEDIIGICQFVGYVCSGRRCDSARYDPRLALSTFLGQSPSSARDTSSAIVCFDAGHALDGSEWLMRKEREVEDWREG